MGDGASSRGSRWGGVGLGVVVLGLCRHVGEAAWIVGNRDVGRDGEFV